MSEREIRSPVELDRIDFDRADGLVPVVVQDADTGAVLMLAYASREALARTLDTGRMHFWSRSRRALWMKGETSGNVLEVASLTADCDADAVLARVRPAGPTCHTGTRSCFGEGRAAGVVGRLDATLAARADRRPEGSYTVRLLDDPNLRLKKLGEESAELVAALATSDAERAVGEAADLLYHVLVALRAEGLGVEDVLEELARRAD